MSEGPKPRPKVRRVPLSSLVRDPDNPRHRTARATGAIAGSLAEFGPARSAVIDGEGVVRAGNGTVEAALAAGIADALVVDAPDDALVVVRKAGWSRGQALAYALADNQCTDLSVNLDEPLLARLEEVVVEGVDLEVTGFTVEEVQALRGDAAEGGGDSYRRGPPEDLFGPWAADNEWGVPTLDLGVMPEVGELPGPLHKWGTRRRGAAAAGPGGTVHFYADDYKFWGLSSNPEVVLEGGFGCAVEPNFSTWEGMAKAEALWWIYSKRVVARWWQSKGLAVVVDLNVAEPFRALSLLGVPEGWRAYATRWHRKTNPDYVRDQHDRACDRAGTDRILFAVFGGGALAAKLCEQLGAVHVPEEADAARGRTTRG
jgi:hypothetical protein